MNKLREKLSVLKVERFMKKIEGIKDILIVLNKPEEINWYSGELDSLNSCIPCSYHFSLDFDMKYLIDCIKKEVKNERYFIMNFFEFIPVYVLFYIESFYDFLNSYYKETNSRDLTLFFLNEKKILDIFLAEHELEIRIFSIIQNAEV